MRSPRVIVGLALLVGLGAVPALAQDDASSTDPQAGSPAGVLYEIPLDTARRDSAPRRRDGRGGDGGGDAGGRAPSSIHSENGFGSSSAVPGTEGPGGAVGDGADTGEDGDDGRSGDDPRPGGTGGSGGEGGGGQADSEVRQADVLSADAPGPGIDAYGLVGILGLLAAGVGIVAGRAFRRPPA